ncbi:serum amyloid P-component-like [Alosa sapidissima]|uniref:serum amyloid P-component-like n=1 Tax=Alosa sapidissima TaxID=34773 RepID=UPI001C081D9C|nr:serum amyloid P-component-like [Alosa sapidissima]
MALSLVLGLVYILAVPTGAHTRTVTGSNTERSTTLWTSSPRNDLQGRMFSMMPNSVVTFSVPGTPQDQDIYGFTVCFRMIAETMSQYNRPVTILTMTMNNSVIFTLRALSFKYELLVSGGESKLFSPVVPMFVKSSFPWTSLCATWDSATGMTQMWKDGKMSVRKCMGRSQKCYGTPVVTLSGFEGQVTDIHVWDKALPFSSLRAYLKGQCYSPGNLLSWRDISYTSRSYVVLEDAYPMQRGPAEEGQSGQQRRRRKQRKHGQPCNGSPGGASQ